MILYIPYGCINNELSLVVSRGIHWWSGTKWGRGGEGIEPRLNLQPVLSTFLR